MASQWYVLRKNKPIGPISSKKLWSLAAQGKLKQDDLVAEPGEEWIHAWTIEGLFSGNRVKNSPLQSEKKWFDPKHIYSSFMLRLVKAYSSYRNHEGFCGEFSALSLRDISNDPQVMALDELTPLPLGFDRRTYQYPLPQDSMYAMNVPHGEVEVVFWRSQLVNIRAQLFPIHSAAFWVQEVLTPFKAKFGLAEAVADNVLCFTTHELIIMSSLSMMNREAVGVSTHIVDKRFA